MNEELSIAVASVKAPPNLTSVPSLVRPLEAVFIVFAVINAISAVLVSVTPLMYASPAVLSSVAPERNAMSIVLTAVSPERYEISAV